MRNALLLVCLLLAPPALHAISPASEPVAPIAAVDTIGITVSNMDRALHSTLAPLDTPRVIRPSNKTSGFAARRPADTSRDTTRNRQHARCHLWRFSA
jgi:hypothetical protein